MTAHELNTPIISLYLFRYQFLVAFVEAFTLVLTDNYGGIGFPIRFTNVSTSLQPFVTDILHIYPHTYIPVSGGICGGIYISFNYNYGGIGFPI